MPNHESDHEKKEVVVFKTPPKMAFIMGILVGVTLVSLTAFGMTYSLLKSDGSSKDTADSNTAKVAGTDTNANTNTAAAPTQTPAEYAASLTKQDVKITADDHIEGDKNAKVQIIEYSDFQCPYCGQVTPTITQLQQEYGNKIAVVFRNFPLTSLHANAQKAAEASECAAEQDKFWEMHDKMFANQTALTVDNLKTYAKDLGLNTTKFNSCLDDGKYASAVQKSITDGTALGVGGTPATFVNGRLVSGARPYEQFKAVVDLALKD
ncbi:MAG: thioredoxin domain-containing protein [Patescibacteria group bacterium]